MISDMEKYVGMCLKKARMAACLTQGHMAEKLEVAKNTISNYETGRIRISGNFMKTWADECGTTVDKMLGSNKPTPSGNAVIAAELDKDIAEMADIMTRLNQQDRNFALDTLKRLLPRE